MTGLTSVVDPHHIRLITPDTDPDFLFLFDTDLDPDSTFLPYADLDSDPSFQLKAQTLEKVLKIGSNSIHFGLTSVN
jgi:hypothetical protein